MDWQFPYRSTRVPILAANCVATTQPLAAQAGLAMLRRGGNAVDAAVATAIALTVVEPVMNGIGGDAFAIVWDGGKLHGLNASGRAPAGWNPERFASYSEMPTVGWETVTVPGAVSAWAALHGRFGRLPFEALFEPAILYARDGFPVSPRVAMIWETQVERLRGQPGFAETFLPNGRAPLAGEVFRCPAQAETLRLIAESKGESFYRGRLAEAIAADAGRAGGALSLSDLAEHSPDWVEPLAVDFKGYRIHELPPNGHGIAALIALGILDRFDIARLDPDGIELQHLEIEAMKLAIADVAEHVADPAAMRIEASELLAPDYLDRRARLVSRNKAAAPVAGQPRGHETIYLSAADASGMMVSLIQSNFRSFGSGVVVSGTGIALHNRGSGFSLKAGHANQVGTAQAPLPYDHPRLRLAERPARRRLRRHGRHHAAAGPSPDRDAPACLGAEPAGRDRRAALAGRGRDTDDRAGVAGAVSLRAGRQGPCGGGRRPPRFRCLADHLAPRRRRLHRRLGEPSRRPGGRLLSGRFSLTNAGSARYTGGSAREDSNGRAQS